MPVHNADVAAAFEEMADLLELQGDNPFRVRAYRNAARSVQSLGRELSALVGAGEDLTALPGIGKELAAKITEIVRTRRLAALERLRRQVPPGVRDLLQVPGLGPKRVFRLYHELDVQTPEQLERACHDGRVRALKGFGAKTEQRVRESIAAHRDKARRYKIALAGDYARTLARHLRGARGVGRVEVAGSYRRARETVGDLDILAEAQHAAAVLRRFTGYDEVAEVLSAGSTRASVVLRCGMQVDLRVVRPESFGAALHYFTGSKAHNIAVRRLGQQRGLKINEYGVFRDGERIAGDTEESVYAAVDLPWIAPELREDHGEIEAARDGKLPALVTLADLRGDLHAHTTATDGNDSLEDMASAARAAGLGYLAVTEHSRRLTMAHGLDEKRLRAQCQRIDALNERLAGITLLKGIEVDILENGALDLPDETLATLDLVVGAVHGHFQLTRTQQTERLLRAMDRPCFSILAHPSGRLIEQREPYDVDMTRVIRAARERGCFLELNASPERLDLSDTWCRMARDEGVLVAVSSDAHRTADIANLRYGIGQARRGWLRREDVLNTRPLPELRRKLRATMQYRR